MGRLVLKTSCDRLSNVTGGLAYCYIYGRKVGRDVASTSTVGGRPNQTGKSVLSWHRFFFGCPLPLKKSTKTTYHSMIFDGHIKQNKNAMIVFS